MPLSDILKKLVERIDLTSEESEWTFNRIFAGDLPYEQLGTFLAALHSKGETAGEITGAVRSMRANMKQLNAPDGAIDIVGTGGDGHGTLNVSTAAALVVAGCGVTVAKHGNRSSSGVSGSSDTLAALGVNLEPEWDVLEHCLQVVGIAFLYAPRHHPAMRVVADVRRELGGRTIFNLLGPLTNPANVKRHLIGVYDPKWLPPMAEALRQLGSERAWLVHGEGHGMSGLDEVSTIGPTDVVELLDGKVDHFSITPEEVSLPRAAIDELRGGDAHDNAEAIRSLLTGKRGHFRNIVVFNSAAALVVAGKAQSLIQGVRMAGDSIDTGKARQKLSALARVTNQKPL